MGLAAAHQKRRICTLIFGAAIRLHVLHHATMTKPLCIALATPRVLRWFGLLMGMLLWLASTQVQATSLSLANLPDGALGQFTEFDQDGSATLAQAQQRYQQGHFQPGQAAALNFGLGARPVWVRLALMNPTPQPQTYRLSLGPSWTDHLAVSLVQHGRVLQTWQGGDEQPGALGVLPGLNVGWTTALPPGEFELWVHAQSDDPLQIALQLHSPSQLDQARVTVHYAYGAMYGFLLALAVYNLALALGLRQWRFWFYSLYLLCFIGANISYTGHGWVWLWPDLPGVQRYVILVFMVLYGVTGLLFASHFLKLPQRLPRVQRGLHAYALLALLGMTSCVVADSHLAATWLAFAFVSSFSVLMLALGAFSLRAGLVAGRYFFAAMVAGLLGSMLTTLTVAGWISFTAIHFHAVEVGVLLEATLLALALAQQFRQDQIKRLQAEFMAQHDALTGLYNRRAFVELSKSSWALAQRSGRPLSVMLLDIDHFKQINDQYGHGVGDQVLVGLSRTLASSCRAGDVLARWGGEEFIVLLPETDLEAARLLAERIRQVVADESARFQHPPMACTVSLGVAQYVAETHLEALIERADAHLYQAKRNGRNQVVAG
ncbi:MAG: diguanylate cyclase [Comamonadaceae bacterium]|nr:MAG: diguanylate cyclase [Comamonadaceae bacterium]